MEHIRSQIIRICFFRMKSISPSKEMEKSNNKNSENKNKKAKANGEHRPNHKNWKFIAPKEGDIKSKKVNGKTHCYCDEPHGREVKPM